MSKVGEAKKAKKIAYEEARKKGTELLEVRRQALNKIYDVLEESQIPLSARQIARGINDLMSTEEVAGNLRAIQEGTSHGVWNNLRDNRKRISAHYSYKKTLLIEVDENGTPLTDIPIVMKKPDVLYYSLEK